MAEYTSTHELVERTLSNNTDKDSDYEELPGIECEETDTVSQKEGVSKGHPFNTIHDMPKPFKDPYQKMLLPGLPVAVKITDIERSPATHIINPNLYVIEVRHGSDQWTIKKRYKHFQHLHQQLLLFRTSLSIPLPTKRHIARRRTFHSRDGRRLPLFPRKPDGLLSHDRIEQRARQLEEYLHMVLKIPMYRCHYEMMDFLEIGPLSFISGLGPKCKEGSLQKRSGGHHSQGCFRLRRACIDWCGQWRWRWFVIKDTWIGYMKPKDGTLKCVLLMDAALHVECGYISTGIHHGLQISNLTRQLLIQCGTYRRAREWMNSVMDVARNSARDFTQPNRYGSFAPVRNNTFCRWFVDGATYFEAVADALEQAKEEIYIADWWLSPEVYMKRPIIQGEIWRLDSILKRKAEQGVKVFVLLYKEVELALGINSLYSKQQLISMHPNIKVLRHPDHVAGGTLLWAHHEKIVCIDQSYAFLGGIDLCYGRWDDHQHRLSDLGGVSVTARGEGTSLKALSSSPTESPGLRRSHSTSDIGHTNSNSADLTVMQSSSPNQSSKAKDPASDIQITVQTASPHSSQIIIPVAENQRGISETLKVPLFRFSKYSLKDTANTKSKLNIPKKLRAIRVIQAVGHFQALSQKLKNKSLDSLTASFDSLDMSSSNLRRTASEIALTNLGLEGDPKMWIGKDYINFIVKDFSCLNKPYQDIVDRLTIPRMPWHDIGGVVQGAAARDVARHFIQRWNFTKFEKAKYYDKYPWLIPKSYEDIENVKSLHLGTTKKMFCTNCQILRSVGPWSTGIKTLEHSIHLAYIDAIQNAVHYIYIENQFFITQAAGHKDVFNKISDALYDRITRAHSANEVFRVYVVMPLLPAFEGEVGTDTGTAIQAITHWNYASICRGSSSLWQRLAKQVGDPSNYITFYGLRHFGFINNKLTTELVYVHSKLMIVDDRIAIIGSANINDRSLLGDRDSEIAVMLTDVDYETSVMNGEPFFSGVCCGSLRRTLFREHLGLLDSENSVDIRDPVKEQFYKGVWIRTAALNTSVFEKVFCCIPSDEVHNFAQLKIYQSRICMAVAQPDAAKHLLTSVKGHLVLLPLQFLCEENLTPSTGTKESLMPVCLWT